MTLEVMKVADQINARIKRLEELCKEIDDIGEEKANAIAKTRDSSLRTRPIKTRAC